jgi:protein SCO1
VRRLTDRPPRPVAASFRLLAGVSLCVFVACGDPEWRGISLDPPRAIPPFTFVTARGDTVRTAPEPGRPMLVFFGYTHCPDVCPLTLAEWSRVKQALGDDAERVRWYFVTVDPARDTPSVAQNYAQQFDAAFVGLSGDSATVADIQRAFSVSSYETPGATAEEYLVAHAAQSFLVDDTGTLRAMYQFNSGTEALEADLRRLLR